MKKALVLMLSLIMLTGCATTRTEPTATATPESAITATPDTAASEETTTPESSAVETAVPDMEEKTEMVGSPTPSPVPTESPEADQTAVTNQETSSEAAAATTVEMSYGVLPFDLAAGTQEWWGIDSSDAAYWAVQDNINAMREACHHNLYALANSSGMNGVGPNTTVSPTRPMVVTIAQIIACAAIFFMLLSAVLWILGVRKFRKTEEYKAYREFKA